MLRPSGGTQDPRSVLHGDIHYTNATLIKDIEQRHSLGIHLQKIVFSGRVRITESVLAQMAPLLPLLKELELINIPHFTYLMADPPSTSVSEITDAGEIPLAPLEEPDRMIRFLSLETLRIREMPHLHTIFLGAPMLRVIDASHNPELSTVEMNSPELKQAMISLSSRTWAYQIFHSYPYQVPMGLITFPGRKGFRLLSKDDLYFELSRIKSERSIKALPFKTPCK